MKKFIDKRFYCYTTVACSAVLLYVLLINIGGVAKATQKFFYFFSPLISAIVIAYILNPVADFFSEKIFKKMKKRTLARNLSVFVTVIIVLALLVFLVFSFIPHLISSIKSLIENMESYIKTIHNTANSLQMWFEKHGFYVNFESIVGSWDELTKEILDRLPQSLETIVNTSYKIGSGVVNAIIVFVISVYLLIDKDKVLTGVRRLEKALLKKEKRKKLDDFLSYCHKIFIKYILCTFMDALFVGVANFIFLMILDLPYAILISVISGICNIIPNFGPFISTIPSALLILFSSPWGALWFIIFSIVLQQIDGYLVKPLFFGDSMGLPAVWVLCSVIICGRIFGFAGILLGIPIASIIAYLLNEFVTSRLGKCENEELPPEAETIDEPINEG